MSLLACTKVLNESYKLIVIPMNFKYVWDGHFNIVNLVSFFIKEINLYNKKIILRNQHRFCQPINLFSTLITVIIF
jgi:hypothetical protein